jgi:hypothetical protein
MDRSDYALTRKPNVRLWKYLRCPVLPVVSVVLSGDYLNEIYYFSLLNELAHPKVSDLIMPSTLRISMSNKRVESRLVVLIHRNSSALWKA